MTKYLLDTNIVLRFANPSDLQHDLVTQAVPILLEQSSEIITVNPQEIISSTTK